MQYFLENIPIEVEKKKIKNMHIYVKPPFGDVLITAPKYITDKQIKEFIRERADWIICHLELQIKLDLVEVTLQLLRLLLEMDKVLRRGPFINRNILCRMNL